MIKKTSHRYPPGLEWALLKRLPRYLVAGTLIPLMMSLLVRLWPLQGSLEQIAKQQTSVDILAVALVITAWTALFTVAIGCCIVWIMKGPRYEADAYPLQDAERPLPHERNDS